MRNDLISRRILLQKIQEDKEFLQKGLGRDAEYAYMSADSVIDKIKSMPIAYDVDNVIGRLDGLRKECAEPLEEYEPEYFIDKSIKIVKSGGIE